MRNELIRFSTDTNTGDIDYSFMPDFIKELSDEAFEQLGKAFELIYNTARAYREREKCEKKR